VGCDDLRKVQYFALAILKFTKELAAVAVLAIAFFCLSLGIAAQSPATPRRPSSGPVVVERQSAAPQVITVVHRINGLKMLRLLMRSGEKVGAVETMDEPFAMMGQVHTNIIAGLSLDDGQTIVAWLPEAEIEIEATFPLSPAATMAPRSPMAIAQRKAETLPGGLFGGPDITVIERDGKRHEASYIGLDGITGLSLLKLSEKDLPSRSSVSELQVSVGQRLRLFSPEPVRETNAATSKAIYVRIGETEGQVVGLVRGASGEISRIRIKSLKLTPLNVGGIAVNDAGQTIGIVDGIERGEATVLSPAAIRAAAKRVLARQTSVPRPWLGVSGESVAFMSLDRIVGKGWETRRAKSLLQRQRGILLNSVAPGSPAAVAALRAGDVIVSVNDNDVKSPDDFSLLLTEASDKPVRLTIVRPDTQISQSVVVHLSEARDPFYGLKMFDGPGAPGAWLANPLIEHGIESVPLRIASEQLMGAANGLLVVYVQPLSAAFKSGLRPGDVIEAIDDQPISALFSSQKVELPNASYSLSVARGKEKLVLTVVEREK
jgi:serine protease Do